MNHARAMSLGLLPALFLIAGANATNPPPTTTQALTEFYQAMDGSNWKRRDNWLDPDIHYCHWHGINCYADGSITSLRLPSNRIAGTLSDTRILDLVERLDLSDNRIRGPLPPVTPQTRAVNLSHNLLEGNLPEISQGQGESLLELQLADNNFNGEVPGSWQQLQLSKLDLSNNQLSGSGSAAFEAMDDRPSASIYLAGNAFAGALPTWLTDYNWTVNLCWTGFDTTEPGIADWVAEHHVGGPGFDVLSCTDRNRVPVGIGHSGSWFKPERSGEGFVVEVNEQGRGLVYWFTYTPDGEEQAWLVGDGEFDGATLSIETMIQPRDTGLAMPFDTAGIEHIAWGSLSIEFENDDMAHVQFASQFSDYGSGAFSMQRLARPMLADCDG